jgi:uncharacterized protein
MDSSWYRPLRRADRGLSREDALALVDRTAYGVLALAWPDGRPYAVPLNHGRDGETLYMHCATTGQKLDIISVNPQAVFCVSEMVELVTGKNPCDASARFASVLLYGRVRVVSDPTEKIHGLVAICQALGIKVSDGPGRESLAPRAEQTVVLALDIEHLSGKARA